MMKFAKWIGGALGWAVGGPIGALIGFSFGDMVDSLTSKSESRVGGSSRNYKDQYKRYRHTTSPDDFEYSLLILSAAVMKADGVKLKSELQYIKRFYTNNYGPEKAQMYMKALQRLLEKDFDLREVCEQIRYFMEHALRLQIIHYLFNLANADGRIDQTELDMIYKISRYLGIHQRDFDSIRAMFSAYSNRSNNRYERRSNSRYTRSTSKADPYVILEINSSATDAEVKKAYRRLARKYHPDKVAHLGNKYVEEAKEKFIIIDEAYNSIKQQRRMK